MKSEQTFRITWDTFPSLGYSCQCLLSHCLWQMALTMRCKSCLNYYLYVSPCGVLCPDGMKVFITLLFILWYLQVCRQWRDGRVLPLSNKSPVCFWGDRWCRLVLLRYACTGVRLRLPPAQSEVRNCSANQGRLNFTLLWSLSGINLLKSQI